MTKTAYCGWQTYWGLCHRIPGKKLLLVMKLTVSLLIAAFLNISAKGISQKVTLSGKNMSLEKIFQEVSKQTGYFFLYPKEVVEEGKNVDIKAREMALLVFLEQLFKGQPLKYAIESKTITVTTVVGRFVNDTFSDPLLANSFPVPVPIKVRITDSKGASLSGATVINKNNKRSGATNEDGLLTLSVSEGDTLLISYIGMISQTIIVTRTNLNNGLLLVRVYADLKQMQGVDVVINTGYQSVRKEQVVGSVTTLDSASYHRRAGMNILDRLDGTVPGVLFDKKDGLIKIRGISSLNDQTLSPLIILDNFPFTGDLNNINPNDIVDVTVLKDATATSIWGARGGNGVIVITTKKARFNSGFSIALHSNISIQQQPDLFYFPRLSSSEIIDVEKYLFDLGYHDGALGDTYNRPMVSPVVEILDRKRQGLLTDSEAENQINAYRKYDLRRDLTDHVYRDKISQQHHLSIGGGSEISRYNFSFGFNPATANLKGADGSKQYTLALNNSFRLIKNLELETGIQFNTTIDESTGLIDYPSQIYPYARLVDDAGNSLNIPNKIRQGFLDTAGGGKLLNWNYNPLDEIKNANAETKNDFIRINIGVNYKFTNWLTADIKYQYIKNTSEGRGIRDVNSYYTRNLINLFSQVSSAGTVNRIIPLGGILNQSNSKAESQNIRTQLNFNKTWSSLHQLNALVAGELFNSGGTSSEVSLYGYDDATGSYSSSLNYQDYYPTYLYGSMRIREDNRVSYNTVSKFVSLLANASYIYDNKYTLYASARRDGANIFGVNTNNRWKPLWSIGANWDILRERFIRASWLSALKLKLAYGYSGNVDNSRSGLTTITYTGPSTFTRFMRAIVGNAPNPNLRWEQVNTLNIGTDFSLFNNRISGSVEFFNKRSTDLIAPANIEPSVGVNNYYVNIASLKGKGYDIVLNSRNLTGKFTWDTRVSISYVKTIVAKYDNGGFRTAQFIDYGINPRSGAIAYGISSYKWAGLDPLTGDPQGMLNKAISKDYYSIFNDSLQNQVFHGSAAPLYSGFLFNSFSWKNFTFSFNITGRFKFFYRKPTISYQKLFMNWQGHTDYLDRWKVPGDELKTNIPSMTYPFDENRDQFFAYSEINVRRGDNIRLQDARLQYAFEGFKNKNFPLKRADIFAYANNLNMILWRKDNTVNDPDYSELAGLPGKIFTFGLNITF